MQRRQVRRLSGRAPAGARMSAAPSRRSTCRGARNRPPRLSQRERQRVRVVAPVRAIERHAVPLDACAVEELVERPRGAIATTSRRWRNAISIFDESVDVGVPLEQAPVEPADLVVLAVGVVVAALRPAHLVAHQQHRRAGGEQRQREEVLDLAVAQRLDRRDRRSALRRRSSSSGCRSSRRDCPRRWPRCASGCTRRDR